MSEVTVRTCLSNIHFETQVKDLEDGATYKVAYQKLIQKNARTLHGWACACRYYQQRGACAHITFAVNADNRCGWNDKLDPTLKPKDDLTCPKCGGPTEPVVVVPK